MDEEDKGKGQDFDQSEEKVEAEDVKALYECCLDDLKTERASFINYKNRVQKEREADRLYANQEIVREFLEIRDNLGRALDHTEGSEDVMEGVRLTLKQLDALLKKHGIEEIDPEGGLFDPNFHEAISAEEGDVEEETVGEVLQKGYLLNGRVIRPAKVSIKKPKVREDGKDTGN